MSDHLITDEEAELLAGYGIPQDDPAAADILDAVAFKLAKLMAALATCGQEQFLRHLSMQVCQLSAELQRTKADLATIHELHAPGPASTVH